MDTKFTPGPWEPGCFVKPDSKCKCSYIFSEGYNGSVAQVSVDNECFIQHGGNDSPKLIEAIANARLIAAAPTMFSFIEKMAAGGDTAKAGLINADTLRSRKTASPVSSIARSWKSI